MLCRARHNCPYASGVRPRYPARNPASESRSGAVKTGWTVARAVERAARVIGHLRVGLRPRELAQLRDPAIHLHRDASRAHRPTDDTASPHRGVTEGPALR